MVQIAFSEWRETDSFKLEQVAVSELNQFFYELYDARLKPLQAPSHQKYVLFNYIQRAQRLLRVLGASLRRMAGDEMGYRLAWLWEQEILEQAVLAARPLVIEADASTERFTEFLVADFESLYQVSKILLDLWALIVAHTAGLSKPRKENFFTIVDKIANVPDCELLSILNRDCFSALYWLHSHILVYRDKFIVHQNRPLQLGILTEPFSGKVRLSYLIDPVWCGDSEIARIHNEIWKLNEVAPDHIRLDRQAIGNPNYVIGHLMEHIQEFELSDRERLVELAKDNGFTTPPAGVIVDKLFEFIAKSIAIVRAYAQTAYSEIKLGERKN